MALAHLPDCHNPEFNQSDSCLWNSMDCKLLCTVNFTSLSNV